MKQIDLKKEIEQMDHQNLSVNEVTEQIWDFLQNHSNSVESLFNFDEEDCDTMAVTLED